MIVSAGDLRKRGYRVVGVSTGVQTGVCKVRDDVGGVRDAVRDDVAGAG